MKEFFSLRTLIYYFKKKLWRSFVYKDILGADDSDYKKALSLSLGIFVGLTPFWGLQTILVIGLSFFFRLNKITALLGSLIGLPFLAPFIIYLQWKIGSLFFNTKYEFSIFIAGGSLNISEIFQPNVIVRFIVGILLLASIASFVTGFLYYGLLKIYKMWK